PATRKFHRRWLLRGQVDKAHGIAFTQAWSTSNALCTQIELENLIAKGLKLKSDTTILHPEKSAKVGASQRRLQTAWPSLPCCPRRLRGSCLLSTLLLPTGPPILYSTQGPTFTADTVLGRDGFFVGAEASYNVTEGRVTKYSAAVGFSVPEYAVTLHSSPHFGTFVASHYHRVSPDVEAGAKAVYDVKATSPGVALEVGTKA
ncbi:hypothetical protein EDB83DRAFT_2340211, partial [Lactarius deliciosus]